MSRKRICKHLPEELLQIEIADIKSFYDYVNNHIVTTDFTKQIDDEISYLKLEYESEAGIYAYGSTFIR